MRLIRKLFFISLQSCMMYQLSSQDLINQGLKIDVFESGNGFGGKLLSNKIVG